MRWTIGYLGIAVLAVGCGSSQPAPSPGPPTPGGAESERHVFADVHVRVEDFQRFREAFDQGVLERSERGVIGHWIGRDAEDADVAAVSLIFRDVEAFERFRDGGHLSQLDGTAGEPAIWAAAPESFQQLEEFAGQRLHGLLARVRVADRKTLWERLQKRPELSASRGVWAFGIGTDVSDPAFTVLWAGVFDPEGGAERLSPRELAAVLSESGAEGAPEIRSELLLENWSKDSYGVVVFRKEVEDVAGWTAGFKERREERTEAGFDGEFLLRADDSSAVYGYLGLPDADALAEAATAVDADEVWTVRDGGQRAYTADTPAGREAVAFLRYRPPDREKFLAAWERAKPARVAAGILHDHVFLDDRDANALVLELVAPEMEVIEELLSGPAWKQMIERAGIADPPTLWRGTLEHEAM